MTGLRQLFYPESAAGGFSRVDHTVIFYTRVNALLRPGMTLLDFGAGRGQAVETDRIPYRRQLRFFKGKVARVIGVDVDPAVLDNPLLDEAHVMPQDGQGRITIPLADASVDIIVADWVLEHVVDPPSMALELERVLAPGGWICARTPNRLGYIALGARLVPERLHGELLRRLQPDRKEEDVFPTVYRLNTEAALRQAFPPERFEVHAYTMNGEPAYCARSVWGWRLMNALFALTPSRFGALLLCFILKKPEGEGRPSGLPAEEGASARAQGRAGPCAQSVELPSSGIER